MSTTGWKCPKCGRRFARAKQWHSCQVVPVARHLAKGGPEANKIYRAVIGELKRCGPLTAVPTKSGIVLMSRTSLGGIHLHKAKVRLSLVLTRRVDDPRIRKVLQISSRSVVHYIDVTTLAELDAKVRSWLREAHKVGMLAGRRPG